jgi:cytochrome c oxidase subunit 2
MRKVFFVLLLLLWSVSAFAEFGLNMTEGVSSFSREVYSLHMLILGICVLIGIGVFGVMFWSIYYHRKSRNVKAAQFHESTTVEIIWTVVPMLILIGMAIPATKTLIAMEDTADADVTIKVTGYQWQWQYDYLDEGISFFSKLATPREQITNVQDKGEHYLLEVDNPLVVPVGKKIRILTTAADVIHSWWVPDLGWKRDAIPGFVNESWTRIEKPGTYRGQCTELCGRDHGFMPVVVIAKTEEEYQQWVAEQKGALETTAASADQAWSKDDLMAKGSQVYAANCVACHQAKGEGMPPVFPALAGSNVVKGPVKDHINMVMNGKPGTAMQGFASKLSDLELAAVITYKRNSWGNNVGDLVQPMAIKALRLNTAER